LAAGLCPDPLGELERSPRLPSRNIGAYFEGVGEGGEGKGSGVREAKGRGGVGKERGRGKGRGRGGIRRGRGGVCPTNQKNRSRAPEYAGAICASLCTSSDTV